MKKILLGATALTLVGMAGAASAQNVTTSPFNLDIGGFAVLGVGYVDTEATSEGIRGRDAANNTTESLTDGQPVQIVNNMEIHFNFELVADNGLTFGYKMELEGDGRNSDEYVGSVSGSFGRLEIGVEDGAGDRLNSFYADNVFTNAADGAGFLFDYTSTGVGVPDTGFGDTGDGFKVTYFTPTIAGFRAGASYAASGTEGGTSNPDLDDSGEGFEFGARYDNTFGAFSVGIGGSAAFFNDDRDEDFTYGGGVVVGFGGFKVSGIYGTDSRNGGEDEYEGFGVGLSYVTGPWLIGGHYAQTLDFENNPEIDDAFGLSGEVVYTLAPGVRTGLVLEYASDTTSDVVCTSVGTGCAGVGDTFETTDSSGFAAGLMLGLTF